MANSANKNIGRSKTEPFVSVLTPTYNGEDFLGECIESVLAQSYENWEYVLVDNKSTDSSLKIMEEYAARDPRIRIYRNTEFLPQMENLNHAFRQISPKSKYCKVVHADDWLFPECISRMVALAEKHPSLGMVNSYFLDGDTVRPGGLPYPSDVIKGEKMGRMYFIDDHAFFGAPSNILIKTDLILRREEPYDPDDVHSDHGLCLDILKDHDFGFIHQVLTFTRRHDQSHTNEYAEKYGTYILGRLKNLNAHGSFYLTPEEFKELKTKKIDLYHKKIAQKKLFRSSKKILDFHYGEMKKMGIELSRWKIFKYIVAEIFSIRRNLLGLKKRLLKNSVNQ